MPVEVGHPTRVLSQAEYHELNHRVMRVVFDVHNEFGRLLDESLYKAAIAHRWQKLGRISREVPIRVSHGSFSRTLFMDMLFDDGLMLEVKTAETIVAGHRAQALQYLFLAGFHHGTLVNLRPARVQHEFVSTTLTLEQRRQIVVRDCGWSGDSTGRNIWECAVALLRDWGACLEFSLYRDALVHLFGIDGPKPVVIHDGSLPIGTQPLVLLDEATMLACTALGEAKRAVEIHLRRLLTHARLKECQWLNFNRTAIELRSLRQ